MKKSTILLRIAGQIAVVYALSLLSMLVGEQYDPDRVLYSLIRNSLLPVTPFASIMAFNLWRKETGKEPEKN